MQLTLKYSASSRTILILVCLLLASIFMQLSQSLAGAQQVYRRQPKQQQQQQDNVVAEMQVVCQSDSIVLMVNTNTPFNGMLYAKDAANHPACLSEFHSSTNMSFRLPLKSCGTLSAEVDDGIEFFNTIVVQPHMRLMTNQGKGYHIRCKYQTRERTIANTHFNVSAAFHTQNGPQTSMAPLLATASMPMCTMKIYRIDQDNVAESVRVGDKLVMVIEIDRQDMYGMRISNCMVRDGMNKAEQQLINDLGCPVDESIMPKFEYEHNNTRAAVAFRAHKFPHTSSIYYQCNVRLCINNGGGCEHLSCASTAGQDNSSSGGSSSSSNSSGDLSTVTLSGGARGKRSGHMSGEHEADIPLSGGGSEPTNELPIPSELKAADSSARLGDMSFDVYSGLNVRDIETTESNSGDPNGEQVLPSPNGSQSQAASPSASSCLTLGRASLLVVVSSLASLALVLLIAFQVGLVVPATNSDTAADLERRRQCQQTDRAASRPLDTSRFHGHIGGNNNYNLNQANGSRRPGKVLSSFYQFG